MITGKPYTILKFVAQIFLPALGTLYFTLAGIWGLPAAKEVIGTVVAVDTFLGVILQISSSAYKKSDARFDGELNIKHTTQGKTFQLELLDDPENLEEKDEILFKVNKPTLVPVETETHSQ